MSKYVFRPGTVVVHDLGLVAYDRAWELQKSLQKKRILNEIPDTVLICEHPPVITCGRSARHENILCSATTLQNQGIAVFDIERGGDVTFHNPGQVILYPILDLTKLKKDVGWYMRALEQIVLSSLQIEGIAGTRIEGKTGVWIQCSNSSLNTQQKKIASIGVRISRWVTMHGLAVNVCNDLAGFQLINPCGFSDITVTSVAQELQNKKLCSTVSAFQTIIRVKYNLLEELSQIFNYQERINHAESNINCSWNPTASGIVQ